MAVDIEIPIDTIEEEAEKPTRTYRLDLDSGRIIGTIDGIEAVNQAIRKAIITARYKCLIYDDDYGGELKDMVYDEVSTPELIEDVYKRQELNLRRHKVLLLNLKLLMLSIKKAEDLPLIMLSDWKKARKPLLRSLLNTTAKWTR